VVDELDEAYDAWRTADTHAREAEHELHKAWVLYAKGGPEPSADLVQKASAAGDTANARLSVAIELMKRRTGLTS
jgi:hypothetical protein